jgi:hypothetical protein
LNKSGSNEITAHISKSAEQFTPKMITDLIRMSKVEAQILPESIEEFKKLIAKSFIFNGNVSDFKKDNVLRGNRKAIFISNVDLGKEKYYREESEGSFTITTASLRKFTRNVQCISGQVKEMSDGRGQLVDVYKINVISNELTEVADLVLSEEKYRLEINVFPDDLDVEILGKLAMFLPTLLEFYDKVQPSEDEINRLRDKNKELLQQKGALHRELSIARDRAVRKPIKGYDRPFVPQSKGVAWGWQIATGVMGVLGYYLPTAMDQLRDVPEWFMAILLIGFTVILRWTMERKKTPEQLTNEANENERSSTEV